MMTNMTDDELREAISTAREEKPDLGMSQDSTNPISGGGCWYFKPFENDGVWSAVDWLSWEYAGILLEEAGLTLARTQSGWRCGKLKHSYPPFIDFLYIDDSWEAEEYEQATRAIGEAYLIIQKREDKNVQ